MTCPAECPNKRPPVLYGDLGAGLHVCDGTTHKEDPLKHHCIGCGTIWWQNTRASFKWKPQQ